MKTIVTRGETTKQVKEANKSWYRQHWKGKRSLHVKGKWNKGKPAISQNWVWG